MIVRVSLDEGALTGKYSSEHQFPKDDFRSNFFAGDRMARTVDRVEQIRADLEQFGLSDQYSLADVAIKFVLSRPEVSSVITGMRNIDQVEMNTQTSQLQDLPDDLLVQLRRHNWLRGVWYSGK